VIRLAASIGIPAVILAALLHVNVWIILGPVAAVAILAYTVGGAKLRCPACSKRVKIGASACHHCGRDVRTGATTG
jgi:hypothetical protein